jgi:hypothetical protein
LCNKYFLKTHLANKHGIIIQNDDLNPTATCNLQSSTTASSSYSPPPQPPQAPTSLKLPISNDTDSNLDEYTGEMDDRSTTNQIEDFCELCKKQFCNKYYLKKHKFDVHGVSIENGIKSYKRISSETAIITDNPTKTILNSIQQQQQQQQQMTSK